MASFEATNQCVKLLFAAPLAKKPDGQQVGQTTKVFMATLADIDDDLLKASVAQWIAVSKWFPSVADLRQTAVSLINRVDDVPDSYTAWKQIKRAVSSGGDVHPMALKAIDALGGIKEFGLSHVDDESSWRARFISAYETYQRRQAEDTMMLPAVAGYIEKRKELNGRSVAGMITDLAGQMAGQRS